MAEVAEKGSPEAAKRSGGGVKTAIKWAVTLAVLAGLGWFGYGVWQRLSVEESTDDAQIDGTIVPISARIGGNVVGVMAQDEVPVKAGDVLVQLDTQDLEVALAKAKADLADAEANLTGARSDVPAASVSSASTINNARSGQADAAAAVVSSAEQQLGVFARPPGRGRRPTCAWRRPIATRPRRMWQRYKRSGGQGRDLARNLRPGGLGRESRQRRRGFAAGRGGRGAAEYRRGGAHRGAGRARAEPGRREGGGRQGRSGAGQGHRSPRAGGHGHGGAEEGRASSRRELNLSYATITAPVRRSRSEEKRSTWGRTSPRDNS